MRPKHPFTTNEKGPRMNENPNGCCLVETSCCGVGVLQSLSAEISADSGCSCANQTVALEYMDDEECWIGTADLTSCNLPATDNSDVALKCNNGTWEFELRWSCQAGLVKEAASVDCEKPEFVFEDMEITSALCMDCAEGSLMTVTVS